MKLSILLILERYAVPLIIFILAILLSGCGSEEGSDDSNSAVIETSTLTELGERIYFDENMSNPVGQSCASCHLPEAGFADPDSFQPVSEGAIVGRFGSRNSPTASYAAHIPDFSLDIRQGPDVFLGGQFLDGRASTLEDQAQAPFLNPLEMNMENETAVVQVVIESDYAEDFETVFGEGALDDTANAFQQIAEAIAAFERTEIFSPFTSRFDAVVEGSENFTVAESNGRQLFNGKANCDRCHTDGNDDALFTDFEYKNIGVPANPDNPFLTLDSSLNPAGIAFVDNGLGAVLNDDDENGKFRTPTLRNIAITAPYMHNGVFDSLEEVIDFYNRRDVDDIVPEVADNVDNGGNIGNLNLSDDEIEDLIAFLETLTDR